MEKQSLIKYYWALFVLLVLLAGSNNAVAQNVSPTSSPTPKPTITQSPQTIESRGNTKVESDSSMLFPIILSILALAVSGGAIALTILKNKEINLSIRSQDKKIRLIEDNYTKLLSSQINPQPSQQKELISYNSSASNNNTYLESDIQRLSERISALEKNKLQVAKNKEPSINYSKNTYQSPNLEPSFNPFDQNVNLSQSDNITQPLENLAYIELVNTYNTNPKLLEQTAIKVSEPTDSINRRHSDSTQKIVLEKANNSNYWVIHDGVGIDCWLLPKINLRIDQFRYETTKALFECRGYNPEYSTFKLVKPAKVIPLSSDEQTWQLESPGILEFMLEN
ncbi:hypothetical protein [Synechocystis sp. PCC 7509]|uniref:hypothetical protein n=1 Tax=Synechocystis sp. PCC 7509 TaxID=927677 RepID=UPI0002AC2755|nr:hypothetical protein [Synechocystis sp. PCC 7509]